VTGFAMGGELRVVLRCVQEQAACLAQGVAARAEVERIEALATDWSERGEIARLDAQGQATVSPEVQALLQASLRVARATRGAFDPTINALWGLYDFDAGREPSAETLAARLPLIDWQGLQLDGDQARLRPGQSVTLGGIAQGYAAAQALALLDGRDYVIPDAVKKLAQSVLAHRIILTPQSKLSGFTSDLVVEAILSSTPVPVEKKPAGATA